MSHEEEINSTDPIMDPKDLQREGAHADEESREKIAKTPLEVAIDAAKVETAKPKEPDVVLPKGLILQFQLGLQSAAEKGPFQFNVTSTDRKGVRKKLRILILEDLPTNQEVKS